MVVFTADDVNSLCPKLNIASKSCIELGLLKETKYISMKDTDSIVSYNFLHLSIQEYLAAIYISSLSFLRQKEILQKTFWVDRYFNMWIMYMGLTEGKSSAFKYLLSNGIHKFIYDWFFKRFHISGNILNNKLNHLYLFQCFLEAKNDDMSTLINSFFKDFVIDLSTCTLTQSNLNLLCYFFLRSSNNQWNELNLSGCNINDGSCEVMHKALIVGNKTNKISFNALDLSNNLLTYHSNNALVDFVQSFKIAKLDISDNPLHVSVLKSICECKFLKVLIAGSRKFLHYIEIREFVKIFDASMLHYLDFKDYERSSLLLQNFDFRTEQFPSIHLSTYYCFVMKNCLVIDSTLEKLISFLVVQETLEYCFIANNNFANSSISSYCATLMKQSSLHEIIIFEPNLDTRIADQLSNIQNCGIIVYSKLEVKGINARLDQILAALVEQPTITKLDIINCREQEIHYLKITNIIQSLMFTKVKANAFLYFAKVLNYAFLEILHLNEVDVMDEAMNEFSITLCKSRSLVEFSLTDSHITPTSTNKIIKILKNTDTIKLLKMSGCNITGEIADNLKGIFEHNFNTLVNLDFSYNVIASNEAIKIIKALKYSCNLKVFRMNGNNITNEAAPYIKEVLDNNINLVEIDNMLLPFTFVSALRNYVSLEVCNISDCLITESAEEVATIVL